MHPFLTPKTLALVSLMAMAALGVARGQAAATPATDMGEASNAVYTNNITFFSLQDQYTKYDWMVVRVDFTARQNPNETTSRWLDRLKVTLTLGWGTKSQTAPEVSLAVSAVARLVAVEMGTKSTIFFFVPPEFLKRGYKGNNTAISTSTAPSFYVLQYEAAGTPIKPSSNDVSSSLPNRQWIDGFLRAAADTVSLTNGVMVPAYDAPSYLYVLLLQQKASGATLPSYIHRTDP